MPEEDSSVEETIEKVAGLLNEASVAHESVKLTNLKHVQELILHKKTTLLDNFLEEILQFQVDRSAEVKKFVVAFIEEACKKDQEVIFKVIDNFRYLLYDENINVQKRAFLAMINIFKNTLKCIAKSKSGISDEVMQTWQSLIDIKNHITAQLDSDNDGVRTTAIKFIEMLIIVLSNRVKESWVPSNCEQDISLDQISDEQQILNKAELLEEGRLNLRKLLEYTLSTHISSVNLITSIIVLSNIAKQRPEYMQTVLEAFVKLNENLPPTLGKSQVSTVKKQLKLQLLLICKNPVAIDFQQLITGLLAESGASSSEIGKAFPRGSSSSESRKRAHPSVDLSSSLAKKSKPEKPVAAPPVEPPSGPRLPTLEEVVEDLAVKLNVHENVADLVMVSMAYLPEYMPPDFKSTYKPIAAAGTAQQVRALARLLAVQFNKAGLVKLKDTTTSTPATASAAAASTSAAAKAGVIDDMEAEDLDNEDGQGVTPKLTKQLSRKESNDSKVTRLSLSASSGAPAKPLPDLNSLVAKKKATRTFKLSEVTLNASSDYSNQFLEEMLFKTYKRVLNSEETVVKQKEAQLVRKKVIVDLTALPNYNNHLTNYIFEDVRKRIDLGLMWIFHNFFNTKKSQIRINVESIKHSKMDEDDQVAEVRSTDSHELEQLQDELRTHETDYDKTLYTILYSLQQRQDPKDFLFSKVICLVPFLTENCLKLLRTLCQDEQRYYFSMNTLCELIMNRINQRGQFLKILLDLTHFSNPNIRSHAITMAIKLHEKQFKPLIQQYALERLKLIELPKPPRDSETEMPPEMGDQWTEDTIKFYLYLFLDLMSIDHVLIHDLAKVYINASPEVKRVILKMVEIPIKSIGNSQEILNFIETFPSGAETLVLRIIHILTEKTTPSGELVNKIRDLYDKRLKDIRFLIPVLTSLTKKEVVNALPQLIKLSQPIVKEIFNRLLGINTDPSLPKSPITAAELLAALHQIDLAACDIKVVINATSICFAEKQIYTQEIMASVMQQLIDVTPLPTLFMRTVIQSVTMYSKLAGFVQIIMQRLVDKQIWKNPKVWEGFVICLQRIPQQSPQILLKLPETQLNEVLAEKPELKKLLAKHVQTLSVQQKAQIPESVMGIITA